MVIPNKVYILFYQVLKKAFIKKISIEDRYDIEKTDLNFWEKKVGKTNETYFQKIFPKEELFTKLDDERHFYKKYRKALKNELLNPTEKDYLLIYIFKDILGINYPTEIKAAESKNPDIKAAILMQVFFENFGFTFLVKYPHLYIYDRLIEKFRSENDSILPLDTDIEHYNNILEYLTPIDNLKNSIEPTIAVDDEQNIESVFKIIQPALNKKNAINEDSKETSIIELKTRRNFDRFENIISSANSEVIVTGTNFDGVLNMHQRINSLVDMGIKFKFLALNPYGRVLKYSSEFSNVDYQKRKKKILNNLELLRDKIGNAIDDKMIELGLFDGFASTGHIGLDINESKGKIIVQHYLFDNPADFAPLFTLEASIDQFWYQTYKRQLDKMWIKSDKIS